MGLFLYWQGDLIKRRKSRRQGCVAARERDTDESKHIDRSRKRHFLIVGKYRHMIVRVTHPG